MKSILAMAVMYFLGTASALAGISGMKGPEISFGEGKLQLKLTFSKLDLQEPRGFYIPKLPNSSTVLAPNPVNGGTTVTVRIAPEDLKIVKGTRTENAYVLPDGRPIPGVQDGEIKKGLRLDLKERNHRLSFYYQEKILGVYVPLNQNYKFPQNQDAIGLSWKGKSIGSLHLVAQEGEKKSAVLVLLRIKDLEGNSELMDAIAKSLR